MGSVSKLLRIVVVALVLFGVVVHGVGEGEIKAMDPANLAVGIEHEIWKPRIMIKFFTDDNKDKDDDKEWGVYDLYDAPHLYRTERAIGSFPLINIRADNCDEATGRKISDVWGGSCAPEVISAPIPSSDEVELKKLIRAMNLLRGYLKKKSLSEDLTTKVIKLRGKSFTVYKFDDMINKYNSKIDEEAGGYHDLIDYKLTMRNDDIGYDYYDKDGKKVIGEDRKIKATDLYIYHSQGSSAITEVAQVNLTMPVTQLLKDPFVTAISAAGTLGGAWRVAWNGGKQSGEACVKCIKEKCEDYGSETLLKAMFSLRHFEKKLVHSHDNAKKKKKWQRILVKAKTSLMWQAFSKNGIKDTVISKCSLKCEPYPWKNSPIKRPDGDYPVFTNEGELYAVIAEVRGVGSDIIKGTKSALKDDTDPYEKFKPVLAEIKKIQGIE